MGDGGQFNRVFELPHLVCGVPQTVAAANDYVDGKLRSLLRAAR
jgi:hypothetical protein